MTFNMTVFDILVERVGSMYRIRAVDNSWMNLGSINDLRKSVMWLVTLHWTVIFFKTEQSHRICTMKMMRTTSGAMSGG